MIFAPTNGPIGLQVHATTCRMMNKNGSSLALGDAVQFSWEHTGASTFFTTATATDADLRKSPLACVVKVDAVGQNDVLPVSWIGTVTDLGSFNGADGTEVGVTFGQIISVKVTATGGAVAFGGALHAGDATASTVGVLTTAAGSTAPDNVCGYALGAVSSGATAIIPVLMLPQPLAL